MKRREAFTLLELLVAVAITLALAGLMLAVATETLTLWSRTQDNFTTAAQARLALDLLERDLQALVLRRDGVTRLAVDVINSAPALTNHGWIVSGPAKPTGPESQRLLPEGISPSIASARFGLSGACLRFVTTNVESGGSLPVAVSYQIARRPVSGSVSTANPAEVRYCLFRSAVTAGAVIVSGTDILGPAYASSSGTPAASRAPATISNPSTTDALVPNAVDFGVWFHARVTSGELRRLFPADPTDLSHAAHETTDTPDDGARYPDVIDVMVRILSERGAALLLEMENNTGRTSRPPAFASDGEWWWSVVEANSRVYCRRVEVKGRTR